LSSPESLHEAGNSQRCMFPVCQFASLSPIGQVRIDFKHNLVPVDDSHSVVQRQQRERFDVVFGHHPEGAIRRETNFNISANRSPPNIYRACKPPPPTSLALYLLSLRSEPQQLH